MRLAAGVGGLLLAAGLLGMVVADLSAGLPAFVSEAGTALAPAPALYRHGLLAAALGIAGLAYALHRAAVAGPGTAGRAAPAALALAAPLAAVSGAVACSARCPLPPYERTTAADLVHAGASIAACAAIALAMLVLARQAADAALRRRTAAAAAVAVPLFAAVAVCLLAVGRATVTGLCERAALGAAVAWLLYLAWHLARRRHPAARRVGPAQVGAAP
ncbi:hypothetical protein GCM10010124_06540 [Pilimelia terevasa]|uniref:DUF998 domain-containing protein n=1 Tax=Pilimelia terevasa TaxID=53372 RepID=A0A8J3BK86_9ACTN|nr:DUF998 domain-containing protein [Pilimelia terevasa]GGK16599.1 hypothetical protein GCM10010124_06540 [Pilimelia terevasa]